MLQNLVNEDIKYSQVRLINENGDQVGVVSSREALERARNIGLDLVEIANKAVPPVCKIMDYSKFKYEQSKKEKEVKKKQREARIITKELWFRPATSQHDIDFKINKAKEFLKKNNRVKLGMKFKGREITNLVDGKKTLEQIANSLEAEVVLPLQIQGKQIVIVLGPIK